jgi:hypothetical protein
MSMTGDIFINTESLTNNRTSYAFVVAPPRDANGNVIKIG